MKQNKKEEPIWCKLYRKEVINKNRHTESEGRTAASKAGFYNTTAWKRIRDQRRNKNPLCQHCEQRGFITPMTTVDHIKTVEDAPELALNINNTQSLCDYCHSIKTKADARNKRYKQKIKRGKLLMKELEQRRPQGG